MTFKAVQDDVERILIAGLADSGNEILSAGVPKKVAAIEKMMREKSPHNLLK